MPLTLPAERHVRSIIPPPPPPPTFDHGELDRFVPEHEGGSLRSVVHRSEAPKREALDPREAAPREGAAREGDDGEESDEELALAARQRASAERRQRWLAVAAAPLAIVAIAAGVRAIVVWGRAPALEVSAANVTITTSTAVASPLQPPAPEPSPRTAAPEPPPPSPKAAPPPGEPELSPEARLARSREGARRDRFEAQAALECGDARRAARAARRATEADPSDAHGWLLLVAAELDSKNPVAANEALKSCLERATKGPRGECIGMVTGRAARAKRTLDLKNVGTEGASGASGAQPSGEPAPASAPSPPPLPRSAP
ncbi:MAG: hypothetical protein JST00_07585 [Deltaproteobacteria bacterium]|nr:hypothetical protein [Deltaproteobacteria bacterium]